MRQKPVQRQFDLRGFATAMLKVPVTSLSDTVECVPSDYVGMDVLCESEGNIAIKGVSQTDAVIVPVQENQWLNGLVFSTIDATGTTVTGNIFIKMGLV